MQVPSRDGRDGSVSVWWDRLPTCHEFHRQVGDLSHQTETLLLVRQDRVCGDARHADTVKFVPSRHGRGFRAFNGGDHLTDVGKAILTFLGHDSTVNQDSEFAGTAVNHFHRSSGLLLQGRRQTGGIRASRASNRALSNRYLLHRVLLFEVTGNCQTCRRRANRLAKP